MAKRGPKPVPAEERFEQYVQRLPGDDACWMWNGTREDVGYGQFWHEGRNVKAHRFAWTMLHGEPPENYRVVQSCRNRLCVNPSHLRLLSPWEKSAQMRSAKPQRSLEERFWSKVNKDGPLWEGTPCWVWIGAKDGHGYGQLHLNRKRVLTHRLVWQLVKDEIPEGLEILHLCNNPACVRPDHLRPDTHRANLLHAVECGIIHRTRARKLTVEQVRDIKRRLAEKTATQSELAREHGVTHACIHAITTGKSWIYVK